MTDSLPTPHRLRRAIAFVAAILCVFAALHLLYSAFCAFTWRKCALVDYGRYAGMIWNCGHGDLFRTMVNVSYLRLHMSFTLALLGPLFLVWDHPFLPAAIQWLLVLTGGLLLLRVARKRGLPNDRAAAFLFLFAAYPYMQRIVLSEFHGISLMLFFVPWLYDCLSFRKPFVWMPLALVLGLREDTGFLVAPMLLYFAVKDKWKTGYVWAACALAYSFGILRAFDWIAGTPFSHVRHITIHQIAKGFTAEALQSKAFAQLWMFLPTLAFLRRGWLPILVFTSVAWVQTLFSPYPLQYSLERHYSVSLFAFLTAGLLEGMTLRAAPEKETGWRSAWPSAYLVCVTLIAHISWGLLVGAVRAPGVYQVTDPAGLKALRAARRLPKKGVLVCSADLTGFCANRSNLISWERWNPSEHGIDLTWFRLSDLAGREKKHLMPLLENGTFGVSYFDGTYGILQRGFPAGANPRVLRCLEEARRTIPFSRTLKHAGRDAMTPGGESVRAWSGHGAAIPATLCYGSAVRLEAGTYVAQFTYRAEYRGRKTNPVWGTFSIHRLNEPAAICEAAIEPLAGLSDPFAIQSLRFSLPEAADIEPRVTGGHARLWLHRVVFEPDDPRGVRPNP